MTITSAPPAAAAEIESWVRAEPRCMRELAIRVIRTASGLHVVATDDAGRVRERVVPDAQTAAVLVVSWMADDSSDDEPAPTPVPDAPPAPIDRDAGEPFRLTASALEPSARWLALGLSLTDDGAGFHGVVDVIGRGHWTAGLAVGWRTSSDDIDDRHYDPMVAGSSSLGDATAFAAYTRSAGRFDARLQLGLGAVLDTRTELMATRPPTTAVAPELDARALFGVRLGRAWGVLGGPLFEATLDPHVPFELSGFLGVERRL